MITKTLPEEKKWLLHNLAKSKPEQQRFIKLVQPLLDSFVVCDLTTDHFGGYAVELWMYKKQFQEYEKEITMLDESKKMVSDGWGFAPSKSSGDDCYIEIGDVLMKHHLFGFLWYK